MNRRSFLAALGIAPVAAAGGAVAAKASMSASYDKAITAATGSDSEVAQAIAALNEANIGTITAGSIRSADGGMEVDFRDGKLTISAERIDAHIRRVVDQAVRDPRRR